MRGVEKYWRRAKYRGAQDPLIAAYAGPKIAFCEKYVSLKGKKILDVGCGNGVFTYHLAQKTSSIVGVDSSVWMLSQNPCKNRILATGERLPFVNGVFDIVFAANLLHHVHNKQQVINEMKRVSRDFVILIEPNRDNPIMFLFSLLVKVERGALKSSKAYLKTLIDLAGLRLIASTVTGMISQNNTPSFLLPFLKSFDRNFALGEYVILIAQKKG